MVLLDVPVANDLKTNAGKVCVLTSAECLKAKRSKRLKKRNDESKRGRGKDNLRKWNCNISRKRRHEK